MPEILTVAEAAQMRADGGVRQLSHRPSQRRCAPEPDAGRNLVRMPADISLRAAESSDLLTFHGIASATERAYEMWDIFGPYDEIIDAAAFDKTLARADLDVPLVLGHDQMRRIARTTLGNLTLAATQEGLDVLAQLDPKDPDVAYAAPKLQSRLYDEMSFAFRIVNGYWLPDYATFRITEVDLHRGDVSIVGWGANPYTSAELRQQQQPGGYRQRAISLLDLAIATGGR